MKICLLLSLLLTVSHLSAQQDYRIETSDITRFWKVYDQLSTAATEVDSISLIQKFYLDRATDNFKKFIRLRQFTAPRYVQLLRAYPKFWQSLRPLTENIANRKEEIDVIFDQYRQELPNFKQPDVCFAIGCLSSGGTTDKNLILIGAEIAASTDAVDKSELSGWLATVIGGDGDIVGMVAHEAIHTQQKNTRGFTLLTGPLTEGIADYLTKEITGRAINSNIYAYGDAHFCELREEYLTDLKRNPKDYTKWLYQGDSSTERPADLGYYLGARIAQRWYEQQRDKRKTLKTLLNGKNYERIFRESGIETGPCWD